MSEPIKGPSPIPLEHAATSSPNVPLLSGQMQAQVLEFADHLQKILQDPSLSAQASFLEEFRVNVNHLNQTVEQAMRLRWKMLRENLKDSAEILSNILNQPLAIPNATENITLLQALQTFSSQQPDNSDLSKMLRTFASNPEPTAILIQELELIARDLTPS